MRTLILCLLFSNTIFSQEDRTTMGYPLQNQNGFSSSISINPDQMELIRQGLRRYEYQNNRDTLMFIDPLSGGMMNINGGGNHFISFYPDENRAGGYISNYNCDMNRSWNQNQYTASEIGGFYYMDEMVTPILAAADGVIAFADDSQFDRWQYGDDNEDATSNNIITIAHANGYSTNYLGIKKNSITVLEGDTVQAGDTIAYPGCASPAAWRPHLLFSVENSNNNQNQFESPWAGECGSEISMWLDQLPYAGDTTVNKRQVLQFISTAYPMQGTPWNDSLDLETWNYVFWENIPPVKHLNPGEVSQDILLINNLFKTDSLKNHFYFGDSLVYQNNWVPGESEFWTSGDDPMPPSHWFWYTPFDEDLPHGDYQKRIFINDSLVASSDFVVDTLPNQLPVVESQYIDMDQGETVEGEFLASDIDGNIFWYNVETQPEYGELEVYGGRKRKFKYHAPENFSGLVEIEVSATDDKGATGSITLIAFNISGELGADIGLNAEKFTISEAFPNPFNPSTTLNFNVQEELTLNITIYNMLGKRVKNLVSNKYAVGDHSVSWDSRNSEGNLVSAGMYIYTIQAGEFRQTRKMMLLK